MSFKNISLSTLLFSGLLAIANPANATIVLFETSQGDFEVNLLDNHTPATVANFLAYVEAESYSNSVIHRSMSNFIVQGGGFTYDREAEQISEITSLATVINEPLFSNVRGTIAMAKKGDDENSATNQWFFSVANNAGNLDNQNGGFTVFGVITTAEGMKIVDAINALTTYNLGGAFTDTPLQTEPTEDSPITDEHLVIIEAVTIIDANKDTQPNLPPVTSAENKDSDSSGGSNSLLFILMLLTINFLRRVAK
ncbi:peptidylprolyl isomerase [Colwelliaceae bacterium BS250]